MAHINFSREREALHEVFKVMYNIKGGIMKW